MALPTAYSMVSSLALSVLTLAAMQVFKDELSAEGRMTILGGFVGSWFFVFVMNVVGNLGSILWGENYFVRLFPEVAICLTIAIGVSASIHRVCATTCLIFSLISLYYINKISQSTYSSSVVSAKPHKVTSKTSKSHPGRSKNK